MTLKANDRVIVTRPDGTFLRVSLRSALARIVLFMYEKVRLKA